MGLMDVIRRAEQRSKQAARHGMDVARHGWEDTERLVRRKWRVHPGPAAPPLSKSERQKLSPVNSVQPSPEGNVEAGPGSTIPRDDERARTRREYEDAERNAIVSINGRDVSEAEIRKSRKVA